MLAQQAIYWLSISRPCVTYVFIHLPHSEYYLARNSWSALQELWATRTNTRRLTVVLAVVEDTTAVWRLTVQGQEGQRQSNLCF